MAECDEHTAEDVREWRVEQLRRLGYNCDQRQHLADLIEWGDLDLETVRKLADVGLAPDEAWWVVC